MPVAGGGNNRWLSEPFLLLYSFISLTKIKHIMANLKSVTVFQAYGEINKNPYRFKVELRMTHGAKTSSSSFPIQYYAVLKARNGEIVFTGETRKRKSGLIKTINNLFPGVVIVDKTQK